MFDISESLDIFHHRDIELSVSTTKALLDNKKDLLNDNNKR